MQLKWEIATNGSIAIRLERTHIQTPNPRGVALIKVKDVDRVRATFGGETVGLERYVSLWLDDGKNGTGVTVFLRDYPIKDGFTSVPDVCIRWAEWRGHNATQEFVAADDKQLYILEDLPLRCVLRFYHANDIDIKSLMERTSAVLADGVPFIKANRPEHYDRNIDFEFCDGSLACQYSFSPDALSNMRLENVVQEWMETARSLHSKPDCPPDGIFQIAYKESIWERIARYNA